MFITGVYDDFYNADFKLKFFIQLIIAKLLIDQGFLINSFHGFFGVYEVPYLLAQFTTVFTFIVIVNAINFSDGIDGLAVTLVIYFLIILEFLMGYKTELTYLNIILILLILPFYFFNSKKINKVFLGDSGSLFLGSVVAINVFNFLNTENTDIFYYNPAIISFTLLFYPLIDLLRVFIIRIGQGNSPFFADNNHLHHRLSGIFKNHYARSFFIFFFSFLFLSLVFLFEYHFNTIYSFILILVFSLIVLLKK
jgi:UDP-N-acetylmuramyl pentapeptide phosphotransferase/UDP-N-acetylglucosamine-1-phosphate transferase